MEKLLKKKKETGGPDKTINIRLKECFSEKVKVSNDQEEISITKKKRRKQLKLNSGTYTKRAIW